MKTIVYIHGAHASPVSFNHIKQNLPKHNAIDISYNVDTGLDKIIRNVIETINLQSKTVDIVSHSLGGVVAVAASQKSSEKIGKIVTMSSPFGGSHAADLLKWIIPFNQLFQDINTTSSVLTNLKKNAITIPVLSMVTTKGDNPLMKEENDNVVTVSSQMALKGPVYIQLPYNHFEILLCEHSVSTIERYLF